MAASLYPTILNETIREKIVFFFKLFLMFNENITVKTI